jgi:autotransporter-associated beta strand protein
LNIPLLAGTLLLGSLLGASAADIRLKNNDAAGTTSITGSTNWSNGSVASAGNAYFTTNFTIRTPAATTSGNTYIFGGDSLSIDTGGRLIGKMGNNVSGNTVSNIVRANFILNGGVMDQAGANSDSAVLTLAGTLTVNQPSIMGALGGTANNSSVFETLDIAATISGSAALTLSGGSINSGGDTGVVRFNAANPYGGILTVTNGNNGVIASSVNRLLQLNNLDAVSNATVNLVSVAANPVSFTAAANTGAFRMGALTGRSAQTLTDTAGSPITLSVGGNNSNTTFSGLLTDGGNLVKTGAGTLILTGTNTYYGSTLIANGTLQLGNGGATGTLSTSSTLTVNGNLTFNRNGAVIQGVDFSSSPISGSGSITQAGAGATTLNAANSYSGTTTVSAGKLVLSTAQTGAGAISVADGAKLGVTVSGTSQLTPATLTLGASAATTLEFDNLNSTTLAPFNVGTLSTSGTVTININTGTFAAGNSYPIIHWTASGPANAASFILGTSPGLTAAFSVANSTLYLNVSAVSDIWSGAVDQNWDTATANWTGNATIFANGQSVLFDDSAVANPSVTVNAPVQPASVMVNNNTQTYSIASSGANNIGGTGGLTKQNVGTLTLSGGANTYTGVTAVNNGTLSIDTLANGGQPSDIGAASTASANLVLNNSTLRYTGATTTTDRGATLGANGATLDVSASDAVLSSSGAIVGAGPLIKTGSGTLALSGASTFSGGLTLSSGQLNINYGGSSSANSAIGVGTFTIAANSGIDNTSGTDVTLLANNPQVWNSSFVYYGSANSLNLGAGPVNLTAACTATVSANQLTVGGVISGTGSLSKEGQGALALTAANTFGGTFNLTEGTLAIGNDGALGTATLNFNGGTLGATIQSIDGSARTISNAVNFAGANAVTIFGGSGNLKFTANPPGNSTAKTLVVNNPQTEFTGVLAGASARTVSGSGTLILSGANTYNAGTTINFGATLQIGNGGTNGSLSASGVIANDGTLKFNRADSIVQGVHFSALPIVGGGSLVQAGSGTVTLNAANTYSGLTAVNNGELFITPDYQGGGAVAVANGARFGVSAASATNSATVGSLALGNGGATTLDFSYTFAGNPTNPALSASSIIINGACSVRIGGTFATGTFPILSYGSLSGGFQPSVVGPRGVNATLFNDTAKHIIFVTVSSLGDGIVWTGTNAISPNLWDLNTTPNWLIAGTPTTYIETVPPGDAVTFNDQSAGLVYLSNTVTPTRVTITNSTVNYAFQGTGQIVAPAGLSKTGAGSLTLSVPGSFATTTVLSNGAVTLAANQTMANLTGNSAISVPSGSMTLVVSNSQNTVYAGNVNGSINLTKIGGSELSLTGSNNLTGTLFVNSGTLKLNSSSLNLNGYSSLGHVGTDAGILTLARTATFTNNSDFNIGDVGASTGTLNLQDSASISVNALFVGSANASGSTASGIVNQTGGILTAVNTAAGSFCIGGRTETTSASGVGIYNISGGTLNVPSSIRVGSVGPGTMNQTGGLVNATGGIDIARFVSATGVYNLDGGTLRASRISSSAGYNCTLNFNGGVLVPTTDNAAFITNLAQVYVRNGGAIIDTTNHTVSVWTPLLHSANAEDSAVDGGLTKRGAGILTLAGAGSTYTGPTLVTAGVLNVAAGAVSSLNALSVSGAALGLSANGGATSFAASSLSFSGNSALNLSYDIVSGTPIAALNASGSLSASGITTINISGYGFTAGQFPLIQYTGTPLANLDGFRLGALPIGLAASLINNTANNSIDLLVTAVSALPWVPLVVTDTAGLSSFNNGYSWQDGNAPSAGHGYYTRIYAVRSPADTAAYTFAGDVLAIDAGGRFILKGTGGQVMSVPNLVLNGGLLDYAVSTADNLIETLDGNITLTSGLTSYLGAAGSTANSETFYINAGISGSGNLQVGGPSVNGGADVGVVVLAGANTYTGATVVGSGTLLVNGSVAGTASLTVNANSTLGGVGSINAPLTVQTGGNLAPGTPARGALTAAIGALTLNSSAAINGTVTMKIDRAAVPSSDRLNASSVTINPGAALLVTNLGSTALAAGDTFTLFSAPITGSFTTVTLPQLPSSDLYWTNKLAVNGTIAVAALSTVNTTPTNLNATVTGNTLTLSWPAGWLGWHIQVQTNTPGQGLSTSWVTLEGTDKVTSTNLTLSPSVGSVFYRMVYP